MSKPLGVSGVITNEPELSVRLAEQGLGLTYTFEPWVADQVRAGRLKMVLEPYAPNIVRVTLSLPVMA